MGACLSTVRRGNDDASLRRPLGKARKSAIHLMLDCPYLAEHYSDVLGEVTRLMATTAPPAPPKGSATKAVPLPAALVQRAKACVDAACDMSDGYCLPLKRPLFCAQWPALHEDALNLLEHEAAALTWLCGCQATMFAMAFLPDAKTIRQNLAPSLPTQFGA